MENDDYKTSKTKNQSTAPIVNRSGIPSLYDDATESRSIATQ